MEQRLKEINAVANDYDALKKLDGTHGWKFYDGDSVPAGRERYSDFGLLRYKGNIFVSYRSSAEGAKYPSQTILQPFHHHSSIEFGLQPVCLYQTTEKNF